jgi:membrane protease YdiL (CAAX protease family)
MTTLQSGLPATSAPYRHVQTTWWGHLLWVLGAALLGWAQAAFFAGLLQLPRPLFLVPYVIVSSIFMIAYVRWSGVDPLVHLRQNWRWGLFGAIVVGWFVVQSVLMQPRSPAPQGLDLLFNVVWLGFVYGAIDGLLLSVLPIAATWQAFTLLGWTERWPGQIATGLLALVASLVVTAAYHLGYPEFQGVAVLWPVFGVGVMSLAYLVTRSPLAPVLSHIAMHVAAVVYGIQSALQLPPHY